MAVEGEDGGFVRALHGLGCYRIGGGDLGFLLVVFVVNFGIADEGVGESFEGFDSGWFVIWEGGD